MSNSKEQAYFNSKMKYVMYEDSNFLLLPERMGHSDAPPYHSSIVSAGFVSFYSTEGAWGGTILGATT